MFRCLGLIFLLFFTVAANATLTVHVQSPYRDDATRAEFVPHVLGGAGGGYTPSFGEGSPTQMESEGDGWFVYTTIQARLGADVAIFNEPT